MPWEHVIAVEKREEFVILASQEGANMSELCRRFGISRKTGYKWLNRFVGQGKTTLVDPSRRPGHSPHKSSLELEAAIVAPSTVTTILHRHQLIDSAASVAATAWNRFEHEAPNHLWQMDFKGRFAVGD